MIRNLKEQAKKNHADLLKDSIADWLVCGLHTGFRSVEWAQERDPDKHGFYRADDPKKQIYAVHEDDVQFQNCEKRFLKEKTDPSAVLMDITWRIQKNRQNNKKKSFAKNLYDNDFNSVASMQHIINHARCYGVPSDEPLAVFRPSKHMTDITNASIGRIMKAIARACYDLDDKQVSQYSTHSSESAPPCIFTPPISQATNHGATQMEVQQVHGVLAEHPSARGTTDSRHPHHQCRFLRARVSNPGSVVIFFKL
jgi:hypothetical protein